MFAILSALALGSLVLSVQAVAPRNVTVDDTDASHVVYNPGEVGRPGWNAEPGCSACSLKPDPSMAFNGTWHDDLWQKGDTSLYANITFTGTAVYLFNIIPNNVINADTNLTFVIDGNTKDQKTFVYSPNNQSAFLYNHTVFSATGLSNAQHTVQMATTGTTGSGDLAILFDYFIYTTEDQTSSSSASSAGSSTGSASIASSTSSSGSSTGSASGASSGTASSTASSSVSTATHPSSTTGTSTSAAGSSTPTTSSGMSTKSTSTATLFVLMGVAVFSLL